MPFECSLSGAGPANAPDLPGLPGIDPVYRAMSWRDLIRIRTLSPKCNVTKAVITRAAEHPESALAQELAPYIGKTLTGAPSRTPQQIMALQRVAVLENHEVTIDALRDTGLPLEIAVDLMCRLLAHPSAWSIADRLMATPTLDKWAHTVMHRSSDAGETHVADDILTLRVLQAFGHDVATPWSFDLTNKWVYFYNATPGDTHNLTRLLDIATIDRTDDLRLRHVCRKAYQAIAHTHLGVGDSLWPHWARNGNLWEIQPTSHGGTRHGFIVAHHGVTCETERWLRSVTPTGCLLVSGCAPRLGPGHESDLSDPENFVGAPARPRIAPDVLRRRRDAVAAHRRATARARLPPLPLAQLRPEPVAPEAPATPGEATRPDNTP
ncbi:hypothetical protein [Pandoraea pnomenusa]|uniref:hypothetical protein n=1 Tax=Pandoraea pnomenusa TaxID=93220 RepID=UPI003340156D